MTDPGVGSGALLGGMVVRDSVVAPRHAPVNRNAREANFPIRASEFPKAFAGKEPLTPDVSQARLPL